MFNKQKLETEKHEIFSLGQKGMNKINKFKGTIKSVAVYITGCDQYLIVPDVGDDRKQEDGYWEDKEAIIISSGCCGVKSEKIEILKMGQKVKSDSGFVGIITCVQCREHGIPSYLVVPEVDKDNKIIEGKWFYEKELSKVDEGIKKEEVKDKDDPGGPKMGSMYSGLNR